MKDNKSGRKKTSWLDQFSRENLTREKKLLGLVYLALTTIVIVILVAQVFNGNYDNAFLCVLTLLLFMIPSFIERRLKIDVPDTLEIIVLFFIFAAEILGELSEYYIIYPYWDTLLHTVNGFLAAAIGFSMINLLNRSERVGLNLSPFFMAMVAFCFSMTIGVLWEFLEFGMDVMFRTDMQKDTILTSISSVMLNPANHNIAVTIPATEVIVNGRDLNLGGYLDIGLYDTMEDLFVNFIGALVFSIFGVLIVGDKGRSPFFDRFVPTNITDDGERHEKPVPDAVKRSNAVKKRGRRR